MGIEETPSGCMPIEKPADGLPTDASDDELTSFFSAFEGVRASDGLKAKTLELLSTQARKSAPDMPDAMGASEALEASPPKNGLAGKDASGFERMNRRRRLRVVRMAALAACLALALSGGVAYAVPVSHVTVTRGQTAIELGVNCFDVTVSAVVDGEGGIDVSDVMHKSYAESLPQVIDRLEALDSDEAVDIDVASPDEGCRYRLEDESADILGNRTIEQRVADEPAPAGLDGEGYPEEGNSADASGFAETGQKPQPPSETDSPSTESPQAPSGERGDGDGSGFDNGGEVPPYGGVSNGNAPADIAP